MSLILLGGLAFDAISSPVSAVVGATNLVAGAGTGTNSVVLGISTAWTASTNALWLHLSPASQSGTGNQNIIFSYDANPGATRTGVLTLAGQSVTVTQAGTNYAAANASGSVGSGLSQSEGVAVDGAGNVYIADLGNNAIKKWTVASNTMSILASSGLNHPFSLALDGAGNIYFDDLSDTLVHKWTASSGTVSTLVSSGLVLPWGVGVDGAGNVYIADDGFTNIYKWANNTLSALIKGVQVSSGVALDAAGNVYFATRQTSAIQEWTVANNTVTTLTSQTVNPFGVAVDGSGNVYYADNANNAVKKWSAVNGTVSVLASQSGLNPYGVAVDPSGDVYFNAPSSNSIQALVYAYVSTNAVAEGAAAGSDTLPPVLPGTISLSGPFAPVSDSSWLTVTGTTNGTVSFSFSANAGINAGNRLGHITVLGKSITVTQDGQPAYVGTTNIVVGPAPGINSVSLGVTPAGSPWTASTNASWLHLSPGYQSGTGSTNVIFSYDVNTNATRTGTLTIAGQTITVTQAGPTYGLAGLAPFLPYPFFNSPVGLASGLSGPNGVAVDAAGNVYILGADGTLKKWMPASDTVTNLFSSGLVNLESLTMDMAGDFYTAYPSAPSTQNLKKWTIASGVLNTVPIPGTQLPFCCTVDAAGNVYDGDFSTQTIKEWVAASNTVNTLVSGVTQPSSLAVDAAGNLYFVDSAKSILGKWSPVSNTTTTLVSAFGSSPGGVAVDGSGNVYVTVANGTFEEWNAASGLLSTNGSVAATGSRAISVDGTGNVYIGGNGLLIETCRAYVDSTTRNEGVLAGTDTLPPVVPATQNLSAPFAPTSDSAWLTISGITNGAVSFAFTQNPNSSSRTAHIALLGQSIPIVQAGPTFTLSTNALMEPPTTGTDSVVMTVAPNTVSWTANPNASWLHVILNQSGTGGATITFSFDTNLTRATRVGTVSIGSQLLTVTQTGVPSPILTGSQWVGHNSIQFTFTNNPAATFTVWSATDITLPFAEWTSVGTATNLGSGQFEFGAPVDPGNGQRFYRVTWP